MFVAKVFDDIADIFHVARQWRLAARKGQPGKAADARLKIRHATRMSCRNAPQGVTQGKS
jgi:hypothetical protein